jgi:anti-sigma factor RsiW
VSSADPPGADLSCHDFVGLVTAYLEGTLPEDLRAAADAHLGGCQGCRTLLAQWRTVIALAGRLTASDVENTDDLTRDRLQSLFRGLRRR